MTDGTMEEETNMSIYIYIYRTTMGVRYSKHCEEVQGGEP